jgi:hypothetical protein
MCCFIVFKCKCFICATYVDEFALVSALEVPENGGVVEIGEVGHVLALFKLGRIHGNRALGFHHFFLKMIK